MVQFGVDVHRGVGTLAHAGEVVASPGAASRVDLGLTAEFSAGESVELKGIRDTVDVIRTSPSPATDSQAGPHKRGHKPLRTQL